MYYELYIDVFFLENFMVDSLLLLAVNRILKCGRSVGWIFAGGITGSILTCAVIILPLPAFAKQLLYHCAVNTMMILTALRPVKPAAFIRALIMLYAAGIFMGGVMYLFRAHMRYISLFYFLASAGYLLLTGLWKFSGHIFRRQNDIVSVTLYTEFGAKTVPALIDSGNELRDYLTGDPVNIVDEGTAQRICSDPEQKKGVRFIPYRCVGGESLMKVFRIRKMCIHTDEEQWVDHPLFGIGEGVLSERGEYSVILNPEILYG